MYLCKNIIMMKKILPLLFVFLFLNNQFVLKAQDSKKEDKVFKKEPTKKFAVDVYGGFPFPTGDVKVDFKDKFPLYNAGIGVFYNFTSAFSARVDYNYTRLHGQNNRAINNEFFENRIHKWSVGVEAHLFNILRFSQISKRFQPFIGVGVGQAKSNVEGGLDGVLLPEHTYESFALLYQASAGFRVNITKWLDAFFRYDMHFAKTDSLDGFDWNVNANKYYDSYITGNLGLTFKIGKKGAEHYIWNRDEFNAKNFESDIEKMKKDFIGLAEETDSIKKAIDQIAIDANKCCDEMRNENENLQRQIDELNQKIEGGEFTARDENDVYEAAIDGQKPGVYHIIVGSFAVKNNAEKEKQRYENMGHKITIIYEAALGLNRLSIETSEDFKYIQSKISDIRANVHNKAWVLRTK